MGADAAYRPPRWRGSLYLAMSSFASLKMTHASSTRIHMRSAITASFVAGSAIAQALTGSVRTLDAQQPVAGLTSADLYKLRSLGDVQLSPDGKRVAYAVTRRD